MSFALGDLVSALDLDADGPDRFTGCSPAAGWRRVFGGLVVAQALVTMGRTAQGRPVHSLHGSFVLPGDPAEPIGHAVERLRDGGSFTARRCVASQHGRPVFDPDIQAATLDHSVWFHRPVRADGWLLYVADSPSASGDLGFTRGAIFDRSGSLVASTAQEGLIRRRDRA